MRIGKKKARGQKLAQVSRKTHLLREDSNLNDAQSKFRKGIHSNDRFFPWSAFPYMIPVSGSGSFRFVSRDHRQEKQIIMFKLRNTSERKVINVVASQR